MEREQRDLFEHCVQDVVHLHDTMHPERDRSMDDWFSGVVLPRHEELDANYLEG